MPLANCIRCHKLFNKASIPICAKCVPLEEEDFQKVKEWLREHPDQTVDELHEATNVEKKTILRFIEQKRIVADASKEVRCGKCGAPAVSFSLRLCQKCSNELIQAAAAVVKKIKVDQKSLNAASKMGRDTEAPRSKGESVRQMMDRKRGSKP